MAEVHDGRDARPIRWLRVVTGVLLAAPVLGGVVVAVLALRTLDRPVDLLVVVLAALPAVAAVMVRRRLVWLAAALPALRAELRRLAEQPDEDPTVTHEGAGVGTAPGEVDRREAATAADELDRGLRDRVTVRGLWKAVRWLRSPASQVGSTAQQHLGPRAAATVTTTTGAAERVAGLVALAVLAAWGTAALAVTALVLSLAAAGGGVPG